MVAGWVDLFVSHVFLIVVQTTTWAINRMMRRQHTPGDPDGGRNQHHGTAISIDRDRIPSLLLDHGTNGNTLWIRHV
jgi:hypothetical protein